MPDSATQVSLKFAGKTANITLVLAVIFSLFISSYAAYLMVVVFDNKWTATISIARKAAGSDTPGWSQRGADCCPFLSSRVLLSPIAWKSECEGCYK